MGVGGVVAHFRDDGAGVLKFALGEAHVADESMQMGDEGGHDLAQARIGGALHDVKREFGKLFLVFDDHGSCPHKNASATGADAND